MYLYLNLRRHAPAICTRVTLLFSCHSYTRRQIHCFTASSQAAVKQQQRPCFSPCYSYTRRQIRCDMSPDDTFLFNCVCLIFFFRGGDLRAARGAVLKSYRLGQDSERAKCAVRNISFSRPPAPHPDRCPCTCGTRALSPDKTTVEHVGHCTSPADAILIMRWTSRW